jgi:hypothetical protein
MAGAITSLWQAIPWATNVQVLDFVKQSADRITLPDAQYGYGIPNFQIALAIASLEVNENTKNSFVIYPNPMASQLMVSFPTNIHEVEIELYNAIGQKVFSKTMQNANAPITIDQLSTGIYYYKIQGGALVQTGKIIKQ